MLKVEPKSYTTKRVRREQSNLKKYLVDFNEREKPKALSENEQRFTTKTLHNVLGMGEK